MPYMHMSYTHLFCIHIPLPTYLISTIFLHTSVSHAHILRTCGWRDHGFQIVFGARLSTSSSRIIHCNSRPEGGQVVAYPRVSGWTLLGRERQPCRWGQSWALQAGGVLEALVTLTQCDVVKWILVVDHLDCCSGPSVSVNGW